MLYHFVPKPLRGTTLYPLNQLKAIYPDLYEQHARKYEWRKEVMELRIPGLNCLWNDVLHLSPVHPAQVKAALQEVGFNVPTLRAFAIDEQELNTSLAVLYKYLYAGQEETEAPDNFEPFDPLTLSNHQQLPEKTKRYYAETLAEGKRPLLFVGIPHVLYRGALDVSRADILEI